MCTDSVAQNARLCIRLCSWSNHLLTWYRLCTNIMYTSSLCCAMMCLHDIAQSCNDAMQEEAEAVLSSYTHWHHVTKTVCVHFTIWKCNDAMQEEAEATLTSYNQQLNVLYTDNMAAKMGLQTYNKDLSVELLTNMYADNAGEPIDTALHQFALVYKFLPCLKGLSTLTFLPLLLINIYLGKPRWVDHLHTMLATFPGLNWHCELHQI